MSKNCFIWTRVSTKYQEDNGGSLDYQKKLCLEYAATHEFNVVDEFGGKHESAKTPGKLIKEMIAAVRKDRSISHILVSEVDRFSRNAGQALSIIDELKSLGVSIIAIKQGINSSNKEGKMMLGILLCTAEWDNANRVDKFLSGRRNCMESGVWCSKAPMGYDKTGKSINTIYTINEDGESVRRAFLWKLQGISNSEILTRLAARGLVISKQQLHKILVNPFYAGKIKNHLIGDAIVDGKHPAMISYSQFLQVQDILSGRTGKYKHMKQSPVFPLRHHVLCSRDYTPLTAYTNRKKHLDYYKCNKAGCSQNTSARILHSKYQAVLSAYQPYAPVEDLFRKVVQNQLCVLNADKEKEMQVLRKNLTEIEKDIKAVRLRFASGKIDDETFNIAIQEQTKMRAAIQAEIERRNVDLSNLNRKVDEVVAICSNLGTLWAESDLETSQRIQNLVFPDGILWDKATASYLTLRENSVFALYRRISDTYAYNKGTALQEAVPLCG